MLHDAWPPNLPSRSPLCCLSLCLSASQVLTLPTRPAGWTNTARCRRPSSTGTTPARARRNTCCSPSPSPLPSTPSLVTSSLYPSPMSHLIQYKHTTHTCTYTDRQQEAFWKMTVYRYRTQPIIPLHSTPCPGLYPQNRPSSPAADWQKESL